MPAGPILGLDKLEGKHLDRLSQIKKDTLNRLKEVYGEKIPQPILDQIDYIIRETYKQSYSYGYNDCYTEIIWGSK